MCVVVDQVTKAYAIANWEGRQTMEFLGGIFQIEFSWNPGAFLSLLSNASTTVRLVVLVGMNSVMLTGIAIYLFWSRSIRWSLFLPLALMVAGGIGNLIDRIRFEGHVADFLFLGFKDTLFRTGIFNVADMAISLGFVLLVWEFLKSERRAGEIEKAAVADTSAGKKESQECPA